MRWSELAASAWVLCLAGCGGGEPASAADNSDAGAEQVGVTAPGELGALPPDNNWTNDPAALVGRWHTLPTPVEAGGRDIVLDISRDRMLATSGCARVAWTYRFTAMRLDINRTPVASCVRALTAAETAFVDRLSGATDAHHRGGRGLVFEGSKGRIVLFEHPSQ